MCLLFFNKSVCVCVLKMMIYKKVKPTNPPLLSFCAFDHDKKKVGEAPSDVVLLLLGIKNEKMARKERTT